MNPKDPQKPSGPVQVADMIVSIDRDLCIGSGSCAAIASKAFVVDNEHKSIVLESADDEDFEMLLEAAKACPTAAIRIVDSSGKVLFPK